ncbi:MAG: DUF664 domain-containing protein, partial [Acidobacteriota bacterium]|nr:DUF664 domain-containing protein [Acidobacteriota bacterium]
MDGAPGHTLPAPAGAVQGDLLGFLAFLRGALRRKLEGLTEEEARRAPVGSGTSLLGLVSHLAAVERYWVHHRVAGQEVALTPDVGFDVAPDETIGDVLARYRAVAARSDELLASCDLDRQLGRSREGRTVGWVLVH